MCSAGKEETEGDHTNETANPSVTTVAGYRVPFYVGCRIVTWPIRSMWARLHDSNFITAAATFIIAAFTVVLAITSYEQWDILQRQAAPYVSIGTSQGIAMELAGSLGSTKNTVGVFFHNAGQGPAFRFWVNAWSSEAPSPAPISLQHLERWKNLRTGEPAELTSGPTLSGGGTTEVFLMGPYTLTAAEVQELLLGRKLLRVEGTFEYCDAFGNYTCQTFSAGFLRLQWVGS
jgi:hypothetical protein